MAGRSSKGSPSELAIHAPASKRALLVWHDQHNHKHRCIDRRGNQTGVVRIDRLDGPCRLVAEARRRYPYANPARESAAQGPGFRGKDVRHSPTRRQTSEVVTTTRPSLHCDIPPEVSHFHLIPRLILSTLLLTLFAD